MQKPPSKSRFKFGDFELDTNLGVLLHRGCLLKLQPQPFRVLQYLVSHAPAVVSKEELGDCVWGERGVHVELDQSLSYCIRQIRQAMGDSATDPVYIETLPRQGYRFIGPLRGEATFNPEALALMQPLDGAGSEGSAYIPAEELIGDVALGTSETAQHQRRAWRLSIRLTVALLIPVIFTAAWSVHALRISGSVPRINSIAVLPLENLSGDAGEDYFADGMTDELITELARIPHLRVVSRTSVMRNKGSHKPLREIANELGVDSVVEGSVVRVGDKVRITAQLIDARTDRNLWGETFEGRASDVLSLQNGVANEIASHARAALLPANEAGEAKPRSVDPVAHDAYMRGLYFYNKRDAAKSEAYFQQAIQADPDYAPGYVGMANALESEYTYGLVNLQAAVPRGIEFCQHAIWLSPLDGEAYTALGSLQTLAWNWPAAESNLKRGLELSPSSSLGETKYAIYLDVKGHPEDAITHMRHALQLDPLSFFMNRHLGSTLYYGRHYDEALEYLEKAKEMEPDKAEFVDNWMSSIYEKKGMQQEAVTHDLAVMRKNLPQSDTAALQETYRAKGWKAYWQARLDLLAQSGGRCIHFERGLNAMRQGDRDGAFEQLTMAVDQHCFWVMFVAVDPILDDLRGDARFEELLRRIKLSDNARNSGK